MIAAALFACIQAAPAAAPRVELPAGPLREAVLRLPGGARRAVLDPADLAAEWGDPATCERWRAALERATAADADVAAAGRASLAVLALRQGRADDAWQHVAALAARPDELSALLSVLVVGAPGPTGPGADLLPALPDGAVLRPVLPPHARDVAPGRVERRELFVRGLHVGAAVIDVRVAVEPEGVQIDLRHVGGTAARVQVEIPREAGFAFANEYVDWFRQETPGPHALELAPGQDERTLYGRFEPAATPFPPRTPEAAPAALALGGIEVVPTPGDAGLALARALVAALQAPPLGWRAHVRAPGAPAPDFSPVQVDLSDPRRAARKLADLCSAIERFTLR